MFTWPVLSFSSDIHKWSTPRVSGTVPGARDGHSACVLGKTMYIFGGYEQLVSLGRKSRFRVRMRKEGELRLVEWEALACLQILRGGMEGQRVTTDPPLFYSSLHFVSLPTQADCFSNDIHKLDTSTMTWTLICTKVCPFFFLPDRHPQLKKP